GKPRPLFEPETDLRPILRPGRLVGGRIGESISFPVITGDGTGAEMEEKTIDAVEFRGAQRQQWNSAATGWRKWSELIDASASGISERLVELVGVEPGNRVLD